MPNYAKGVYPGVVIANANVATTGSLTMSASTIILGGGNVYFPWPEQPHVSFERAGSSHQMVSAYAGLVTIPGEMAHFDNGFQPSAGEFEVVSYADQTVLDYLNTIWEATSAFKVDFSYLLKTGALTYDVIDQFRSYMVKWAAGDSFHPEPHPGFLVMGVDEDNINALGKFKLTMKFKILVDNLA